MHPVHIFISVTNLICGFAMIIALSLAPEPSPFLMGVGVFGGYIMNAVAVLITIMLSVLFAYHYLNKNHKKMLHRHWLGLFNGTFVVTFWLFITTFYW